MLEEPLHHRLVEWLGLFIALVRRCIEIVVDDRVNQQLVHRDGFFLVACHHRHDGSQVSAGALATYRHPLGVAVDFRGMRQHP